MVSSSAFQKFSEMVRYVAQKEARKLNHQYIGTEHILLGLVRDTECVAARVLSSLGVDLKKLRFAIEFVIPRGEKSVQGEIGFTPRTKKVVKFAFNEAPQESIHIRTEHLLIGLLLEGEGVAAGVLESFDVTLDKVRAEIARIKNGEAEEVEGGSSSEDKFLSLSKKLTTLMRERCVVEEQIQRTIEECIKAAREMTGS